MKNYYTIAEAAERIGTTRIQVYRWLFRGALKPVARLGKSRHLVTKDSVKDYLREAREEEEER